MFKEVDSYHQISYLGVFLWFLFLEQLTPIPEEVTLLSNGHITQHHLINPYYAGLRLSTMFFIGWHFQETN